LNEQELRRLLESLQRGEIPVEGALERLRHLPFEDLGFARVDHHRALRHGFPEVIFGRGKTVAEVTAIAERIIELDARNPQVASRLARCFDRWKKFDAGRQAHARQALERVRSHQGLSRDVLEIVSRALGPDAT